MANVNASASATKFTAGSNAPGWGPATVSPTVPSSGAANGVVNDLGNDVVVYINTPASSTTVVNLTFPGPSGTNPQTNITGTLTIPASTSGVTTVLVPQGGVIALVFTGGPPTWVWVQQLGAAIP